MSVRGSLAVLVLSAATCLAQDADERLSSIAELRGQALAAEAGLSERLTRLDEAMEAREALLRDLAEDPRRPIWLLDQAADTLLAMSLMLHDARLSVGLLSRSERARALDLAEEAYVLADTAGGLIDTRFERQRAALAAGEDVSQPDRALNRQLAEQELAVRRPLIMGRAMALRVAAGGADANPTTVLDALRPLRLPPGQAAAIRGLSVATALRASGGRQRLDEAAAALDEVLSQGVGSPVVLAEAAILRSLLAEGADVRLEALAEAMTRAPFVDAQGLADAALMVLAIEARARVLLEAGMAESAAEELMQLEFRRDLAGTPRQRAAVADERLAALATRVDAWADIAPDTTVRVARALVGMDDPASDRRAMDMLEQMLAEIGAERQLAAREGRAFVPPSAEDVGMDTLARLYLVAAERAEDPQEARRLRTRALELVLALHEAEQPAPDALLAAAASLLVGALGDTIEDGQKLAILDAAVQRVPDHADLERWRLGRAALRIRSGQSVEAALADAQSAMESETPAIQAEAIRLAGAAHAVLVSDVEQPPGSKGVRVLRAALEHSRRYPETPGLEALPIRLRLAQALVDAPTSDAAREALGVLEGLTTTRATVLRGFAFDRLGDSGAAVAELRNAAPQLTPQRDGRVYWEVWTRLLELINQERRARLRAGNTESGRELAGPLRGWLLELRAKGPPVEFARRLRVIEDELDR
jgi:hypothetical protein